ncbi:hypothetical protein EDC04DRAFT_3088049 [Pisolithus marmoratus]|nr:hypothetical protein EDC04DRAFT_3088049 [Pisolithus marmoratus]
MTFSNGLHSEHDPALPDTPLPSQHVPPHSSYHHAPNTTEDILHLILRTRKSWKTLKGQTEAVWPPLLEATMLKALQEYVPEDSRETRILGRFPMRNRFISDYIYRSTGKVRSAKQVGSRLQQLRDTAEGRQLIDSLTRCYRAPTRPQSAAAYLCSNTGTSACQPLSPLLPGEPFLHTISFDVSSSNSSCTSSPSSERLSLTPPTSLDSASIMSPPSSMPKQSQAADSRTPVYIDILPDASNPRWSSSNSSSSFSAAPPPSSSSVRPPGGPGPARRMRDIEPIVTFVSPTPVVGKSTYIVLLDGAPVHSEDTKLEYVGPYYSAGSTSTSSSSSVPLPQSNNDRPVLYNTALVPRYWNILCKAADPTLYTIIQDVYRPPDNVSTPSPYPSGGLQTSRPRPIKIFSAIYHFRYPPNVKPGGSHSAAPSTLSMPGSRYSPSGSYSSHSPSPIAYTASTSSSSSLSPMLSLKPGLGSVGYGSPMHPTSSSSSGMGQYGLQQQVHSGYANPGQHGQGYGSLHGHTHAQGGYARYGAYPPASSASHAAAASYTSAMNATPADTPMFANEEDFFRFDEDMSQNLSGDSGSIGSSSMTTGSMRGTTGGSNTQSPAPFFPKDLNSYFM